MIPKKEMKIVIVEDDIYYNRALTKYVRTICNPSNYPHLKFEISSYVTAQECIENFDNDTDLMIIDYYLVNEKEDEVLTGEDVINEVRKVNPDCHFIVITEQESPQVAANLIRLGIDEYIDKNVSNKDRLGAVLQKMLNTEQLKYKMSH